ncbi:uncharacterized protein LOC134204188 [Armigeres subalbatus]|uniref:uncharacterized protein LOC134204188 n=1 Tax=Armigeres subalbatus TaxID=124917 RepID=UPI002ED2EEDF
MPPIVILCLQLFIGTLCGASPYIRSAVAGPTAMFPSSGPTGHRTSSTSSISTSKRQPTTLIESGDGFAYRQHHQPPGQLQKHHQPPDEGYLYGQHHFRQPQAYPPDHHLYQPGPMSPYYRDESTADGYMSDTLPESKDYNRHRADGFDLTFREVPPSSSVSAEMENEIDGNPVLFTDDSKKPSSSGSGGSSNNINHNGVGGSSGESFDLIRQSLERIREEEDIDIKSELLMRLLEQMPEGPLPVVYIEDSSGTGTTGTEANGNDDMGLVVDGEDQLTDNGNKRSGRYYRRYPWKRQNSRSRTYDADARYLCVPSRDDIFKLLVGLHENRTGNQQRTINFCNRKRPAKAIFTNIRFLG